MTAPFNYYYPQPYSQPLNPMISPMNMGGMDTQYNYDKSQKR
jgi:hypothetical protein